MLSSTAYVCLKLASILRGETTSSVVHNTFDSLNEVIKFQ